jgi:hypothetical protein
MIAKLTKLAGLRQLHTTPTLAENIQPVIIVDDARTGAGVGQPAQVRKTYTVSAWGTIAAGSDTFIQFRNNSALPGAIYRLKRLIASSFDATGAPLRMHVGVRDAAIGGAFTANYAGYPNRTQTPSLAADIIANIGNAAGSPADFTTIKNGIWFATSQNPVMSFGEELDVSLNVGNGLIVQTFGLASGAATAGVVALAATAIFEQQSQG